MNFSYFLGNTLIYFFPILEAYQSLSTGQIILQCVLKMSVKCINVLTSTGYTNSATHAALRIAQLVDFIVCYCCCFSAFLSSPVFHPAVTFWCDRQDVSFVLLHFSRWSAGRAEGVGGEWSGGHWVGEFIVSLLIQAEGRLSRASRQTHRGIMGC